MEHRFLWFVFCTQSIAYVAHCT